MGKLSTTARNVLKSPKKGLINETTLTMLENYFMWFLILRHTDSEYCYIRHMILCRAWGLCIIYIYLEYSNTTRARIERWYAVTVSHSLRNHTTWHWIPHTKYRGILHTMPCGIEYYVAWYTWPRGGVYKTTSSVGVTPSTTFFPKDPFSLQQ